MIPPVLKEMTVPTTPARAFEIFWSEIGEWWPLHTHSLSGMAGQKALGIEIEPRLGGAITEIMENGDRAHWGDITEWAPGEAMAFTWQMRRPATEATQVRIFFVASEAGTKVSLTHAGWEAQGSEGAANREGYNSGWNAVFLKSYKDACAAAAAG